jgi:hypothetical protein
MISTSREAAVVKDWRCDMTNHESKHYHITVDGMHGTTWASTESALGRELEFARATVKSDPEFESMRPHLPRDAKVRLHQNWHHQVGRRWQTDTSQAGAWLLGEFPCRRLLECRPYAEPIASS